MATAVTTQTSPPSEGFRGPGGTAYAAWPMSERAELRVSPEISERYPDYRALVVYAAYLRNGPSDERSRALLRDAERQARERFAGAPPQEHPHIAAWRAAYGGFGAKPSRFRSSVEALVRRALSDELPPINRLVDLYNAVSVAHVLPLGGEDRDQLSGDDVLRFAGGEEPFVTYENGELATTTPEPGEVVWADDSGVTCRRWNWRQCARTALTEKTERAFFVLDALGPCGDPELEAAGEALRKGLRALSPGCSIETALLR
jgi:DNA/RNA-binding domain of Phe-tRNA-synthetase-like protein